MFKKALSLLTAFAMLACAMPVSAYAEETGEITKIGGVRGNILRNHLHA